MDWELRLGDAMSRPAQRMARALGGLETSLRGVDRAAQGVSLPRVSEGMRRSEQASKGAARAAREAEGRLRAQMREDRARAKGAEATARQEARAKAAALRYQERAQVQAQREQARGEAASQRQAQRASALASRQQALALRERNRQVDTQNRSRIRAEVRAEREIQRAQAQSARDQQRAWSALTREQSQALAEQRSAVQGVLPGQAGVIMAIAAAALAAATAVAALGAAFTKAVVSAVAFRQAAIGAMTILRGEVEARKVYQVGITLAARWNLDPREAVTQLQELLSKGFSGSDARVLLTAMADLKVLSPTANLSNLMLAIGQIKAKGRLQMEELQQQLAEAGINVGKVLEIIGKKTGRTVDQVRKDISAGKVDSNTGIWAIVKSIEEMGGGKLGSVADKASKSISSMLQGLQFRPGLLALKIAEMLEGGAGEGALKGALEKLLAATDPEKSPGMKKLMASASRLANELLQLLFGPLSGDGGASAMQDVLTRAATVVQALASGIRAVRPVVQEFLAGFGEGARAAFDVMAALAKVLGGAFGGEAKSAAGVARLLGKGLAYLVAMVAFVVTGLVAASATFSAFVAGLVSGFLSVMSFLASLYAQVSAFKDMLLSAGSGIGSALVEGIVAGLQSGVGWITAVVAGLGETIIAQVKSVLGIASPSRVMAELGGYTAQGFAQGVEGGQGQIDAAMTNAVAPPVAAPAGAAASASAGGVTIQLTVQVFANTSEPAAIGAEAGKATKAALADIVDDLAAQLGLSPLPTT